MHLRMRFSACRGWERIIDLVRFKVHKELRAGVRLKAPMTLTSGVCVALTAKSILSPAGLPTIRYDNLQGKT